MKSTPCIRSRSPINTRSKRQRTSQFDIHSLPYQAPVKLSQILGSNGLIRLNQLKLNYDSDGSSVTYLHDYFRSLANHEFDSNQLNGKITLDGPKRCGELRYVDSYGNSPIHYLALYASFKNIEQVLFYFKQTINREKKKIFFEINQQNNDHLTAYDIIRLRAKSDIEKMIALKFFNVTPNRNLPLSTYGDCLPSSDELKPTLDGHRDTKAAKRRALFVDGADVSLRTPNSLTAQFNIRTIKKACDITIDFTPFTSPTIFGVTQLPPSDIPTLTDFNGSCFWSIKKLKQLNIEKLTSDLCSVTHLNQLKLKKVIHDLFVLMIIIDDFNELSVPLVSEAHYHFLSAIVDCKEANELRNQFNDYQYVNDPIYQALITTVCSIDQLIPHSHYWKTALKEHFESTRHEKEFIRYLDEFYRYKHHEVDCRHLNSDHSFEDHFTLLGSRTVGINVIYQIILAYGDVPLNDDLIQEYCFILSVLARISNDAQSGLKELHASLDGLNDQIIDRLWTKQFLTQRIHNLRQELHHFGLSLPVAFPIIFAETSNQSIQHGFFSLVVFYSKLLTQLERLIPDVLETFTLQQHRQVLFAITNWTISKTASILDWSNSISKLRYKQIAFKPS